MRRRRGRAGPSPLLKKCRKCGAALETAVHPTFAVCARCNTMRRGVQLAGVGGLTIFFDGPDETANPINFPDDGAYGLD